MSINSVVQTASMAARDELRQAHNQLAILTANQALTAAGCATATTTSKAKTVNTLTFLIDGAFYSLAATDNFWTLAGTVVAASSWQKYYLLVNSAGAASVLQGTQSLVSAAAVALPTMPQSLCVAGVLTIATSSAVTFTPGTTLLGATGITATFNDGIDPTSLSVIKIGQ